MNMMKKIFTFGLIGATLLSTVACGDVPQASVPEVDIQEEVETPEVSAEPVVETPAEEVEESTENEILMGDEFFSLVGHYDAENGDTLFFNEFSMPREEGGFKGDIEGTINGEHFRFLVSHADINQYPLADYNTYVEIPDSFITVDGTYENAIIRIYENGNLIQTYVRTELMLDVG